MAVVLSQSVIMHIIQSFFLHYHVYNQEHKLLVGRLVPSDYVELCLILKVLVLSV